MGREAGPDERTPAEIRRDIQRTRADLDATVDALGRRLQPRRLLWEARHRLEPRAQRVREGVAREAGDHRGLLLAGLGLLAGAVIARGVTRRRRRPDTGFPSEQEGL